MPHEPRRLWSWLIFDVRRSNTDIAALSDRSMELRKRFAEFERHRGGREWRRAEVMQGFVGDVGDLIKLVMAKEGARPATDVDRKLGHELADCFWSILVLAREYGIDLGKEFIRMRDETEQKIQSANHASP